METVTVPRKPNSTQVRLTNEAWELIREFQDLLGNASKSSVVLIGLRILSYCRVEGQLTTDLAHLLRLPTPETTEEKRETRTGYLPLDAEAWVAIREFSKLFRVSTLADTLLIALRILKFMKDEGELEPPLQHVLGVSVANSSQRRKRKRS